MAGNPVLFFLHAFPVNQVISLAATRGISYCSRSRERTTFCLPNSQGVSVVP